MSTTCPTKIMMMNLWNNHKKQRIADENQFLNILSIPQEVFVNIFSYCDPEDVHYAIPLVCRHFREALKKRWTDTNTGDDFSDTYSCTQENLVWKQFCRNQIPSIEMIKNDELYCFRKYYIKRIKLKRPCYVYEDVVSTDEFNEDVNDERDVYALGTYYRKNMEELEDEFDLFGLKEFLEDTYIWKEKIEFFDDYGIENEVVMNMGTLTVLSPYNGTSMKLCLDVVPARKYSQKVVFSHHILDVQGKILYRLDDAASYYEWDIGSLWTGICHLGLDRSLPNGSKEEKSQFVKDFVNSFVSPVFAGDEHYVRVTYENALIYFENEAK
jgi:hypothetical protein